MKTLNDRVTAAAIKARAETANIQVESVGLLRAMTHRVSLLEVHAVQQMIRENPKFGIRWMLCGYLATSWDQPFKGNTGHGWTKRRAIKSLIRNTIKKK